VQRTITVIETRVVKTGTSTTGKPWTLYEVVAVSEDGAPIEEKLTTFDQLQGTVTVDVERKEHEKYGVSYTLKLPKGAPGAAPPPSAGARLGPSVDTLRERVELLEKRVDQLVTTVGQMRGGEALAAPAQKSEAMF
jgi:hypothetical protein